MQVRHRDLSTTNLSTSHTHHTHPHTTHTHIHPSTGCARMGCWWVQKWGAGVYWIGWFVGPSQMEDRMVREAGGIHASHTQICVEYLKVACSKDVTWGTPGCKGFLVPKRYSEPSQNKNRGGWRKTRAPFHGKEAPPSELWKLGYGNPQLRQKQNLECARCQFSFATLCGL